ncbi:hypothetical protein LCGC14_1963650 [marine sediment metagenome]|uniref:Uncharacterized protein n=1 Tax=marine sediment metagenome TaxID=412755 RepID=A0A0F9FE65_9ZZZZ
MNEQYYYSFLYLLRQTVELLEKYWWWWVAKVHAYPLTAITIVLMGILILKYTNKLGTKRGRG